MAGDSTDYSDLHALFVNTTLTRSPQTSHTQRLVDISAEIMARQGVRVDQFRSLDHDIATGVPVSTGLDPATASSDRELAGSHGGYW